MSLYDILAEKNKRIAELEAQKDGAYKERDMLVAALSKLFPSYLGMHDVNDTDWDDDWRVIVFIDLPTGQVSWHIHDSEFPMFDHLQWHPRASTERNKWYSGKKAAPIWDGHTTEEKYERLAGIKPTWCAGSPEALKHYIDRKDTTS